jgi:hypothetical protein
VGALRDNTGDYQASFLVLTMLLLAGMVAILASGQTQTQSRIDTDQQRAR